MGVKQDGRISGGGRTIGRIARVDFAWDAYAIDRDGTERHLGRYDGPDGRRRAARAVVNANITAIHREMDEYAESR